MHSQKEIKADHEPESPVLGACRQSVQTRWAVYTMYLCVDDPDLNEIIMTKQELRAAESNVNGTDNVTLLFTLYLCGADPGLNEINQRKQAPRSLSSPPAPCRCVGAGHNTARLLGTVLCSTAGVQFDRPQRRRRTVVRTSRASGPTDPMQRGLPPVHRCSQDLCGHAGVVWHGDPQRGCAC